MSYIGYIYETTNLVNGKKYIGMHKSPVFENTYCGSGKLIRKAVEKYGRENFKVVVLEWCETVETLQQREVDIIVERNADKDPNYYNIIRDKTPILYGEQNGFYGKRHTEESKRKFVESRKKYMEQHPEKQEQINESIRNYYQTEEGQKLRQRISNRRLGLSWTEEQRFNYQKYWTPEHREESSRRTMQRIIETGFIDSYWTQERRDFVRQRFAGIPLSEEHKLKIAKSLLGKEHPWQDKINKNPEKIRKSAEKHRGMKRSEEARKKMSEAAKGRLPSNTGKKTIFCLDTQEIRYIRSEEEVPSGWVIGAGPRKKIACKYCGKLCAPNLINRFHQENCPRKHEFLS